MMSMIITVLVIAQELNGFEKSFRHEAPDVRVTAICRLPLV
jgi:hypothetical protein